MQTLQGGSDGCNRHVTLGTALEHPVPKNTREEEEEDGWFFESGSENDLFSETFSPLQAVSIAVGGREREREIGEGEEEGRKGRGRESGRERAEVVEFVGEGSGPRESQRYLRERRCGQVR